MVVIELPTSVAGWVLSGSNKHLDSRILCIIHEAHKEKRFCWAIAMIPLLFIRTIRGRKGTRA